MDENKKHRAVINIQLEVHPLESNGECSGHIIPEVKLKEYGIKSRKLYKVDGENLNFTLLKLQEILEQFK